MKGEPEEENLPRRQRGWRTAAAAAAAAAPRRRAAGPARQRTRVRDRRSGPSSARRPAPRRPRPGQQRAPGRRCLQPAPPSARPRDAERRAPEAAARLGPVARTRRPDAAATPAGLSLLRRHSEHPWVTPVCGGHGYHERRSNCEGGLATQTRGIH